MSKTTIVYDQDNYPSHIIMRGGSAVISGAVNPGKAMPDNPAGDVVPSYLEEIGKSKWVPWGYDNDQPRQVVAEVRKSGPASRAMRLKVQTMYGQRLVPCKVLSFDPNTGQEELEYVNDKDILGFLKRSNIDQLRAKCLLDYEMLGNVFPLLCLNDDRSEIVMISHDKASKFRFAPFDAKLGRIDSVFRSANWPNPAEEQYEEIKAISSSHWYYEVDRIKADTAFKYAYPINCLDVLNDYYAVQAWMAIYLNKTLQNSNAIPAIEASIIENIWSIKYHIEISRQYWEYMFPNFTAMTKEQRDQIVNDLYKSMNDFLRGKDNQMKTFISTFGTDQNGKPVPGIVINVIEDKDRNDKWIPNLTSGNKEIFLSFGINPAQLGLGSPDSGSGHAGGSNGGSNIRESQLMLAAAVQMDRQLNYGWWDFVKEYNGYPDDVVLRTIDLLQTTLDTGAGTTKTLT